MTSKLKCPYSEEELKEIRNNFKGDKFVCPFCQQDLRTVLDSPFYTCDSCGYTGYKQLWSALIQAKQDLEIAVDALKRIKEPTAWGSLYQEQEIAEEALEQIEHKDENNG